MLCTELPTKRVTMYQDPCKEILESQPVLKHKNETETRSNTTNVDAVRKPNPRSLRRGDSPQIHYENVSNTVQVHKTISHRESQKNQAETRHATREEQEQRSKREKLEDEESSWRRRWIWASSKQLQIQGVTSTMEPGWELLSSPSSSSIAVFLFFSLSFSLSLSLS